MRFSQIVATTKRRWYVLVGVLAAFVALGWGMTADSGTYYSKTAVWFTLNAAPSLLPESGAETPDLIAFAGAVATELNKGRAPARYSSPDAPYYGAGVRQGTLVGLRDVGGQWSNWFSVAVIELQIVGPTQEWVAEQQASLLARIDESVRAQGSDVGEAANRVTVQVEPLTRDVEYIGASPLMRAAAYAALAVGAVLAGTWAAVAFDWLGFRFRVSRMPGTRMTETEHEMSHR